MKKFIWLLFTAALVAAVVYLLRQKLETASEWVSPEDDLEYEEEGLVAPGVETYHIGIRDPE